MSRNLTRCASSPWISHGGRGVTKTYLNSDKLKRAFSAAVYRSSLTIILFLRILSINRPVSRNWRCFRISCFYTVTILVHGFNIKATPDNLASRFTCGIQKQKPLLLTCCLSCFKLVTLCSIKDYFYLSIDLRISHNEMKFFFFACLSDILITKLKWKLNTRGKIVEWQTISQSEWLFSVTA